MRKQIIIKGEGRKLFKVDGDVLVELKGDTVTITGLGLFTDMTDNVEYVAHLFPKRAVVKIPDEKALLPTDRVGAFYMRAIDSYLFDELLQLEQQFYHEVSLKRLDVTFDPMKTSDAAALREKTEYIKAGHALRDMIKECEKHGLRRPSVCKYEKN